ncbi:MAG: metallopeptidase TldD-related protein [Succinivibrio sp.]|uniref:Metalloprotease PmbA n=1 Tax=Succinivibrio faecicola TaxID=2820300 RepID=A0ABS7DHS9_9GAMM|nr:MULTISPECIES: metallopeptidase TldD-related protein [Succinivibrio]MBW7570852.1 metalloprotease PmbA [Succinivibrio faecicola]MDD6205342.1 metallopeptidase TldD-related protein [Succinivibrio sp.]
MSPFIKSLKEKESRLEQIASDVVKYALKQGASDCEVSLGGAKGLSVSSRDQEIENIEYNNDNGMEIVVYLGKKRGGCSTTDLSKSALEDCVNNAINLAKYTDEDDCAGLCDKDMICTDFKELERVYENNIDADSAAEYAIELEKIALEHQKNGIKKSDGSALECSLYTSVLANSNGFCHASSASSIYASIVLLGQGDDKMQRASGYSIARNFEKLSSKEEIVNEAIEKTLLKLNSKKVKTGKYNLIFKGAAAASIWSCLASAISGAAVYRRTSFLCDSLNQQIFPEFITINENPFVTGEFGSRNYDGEGSKVFVSDIVKAGKLEQYLLGSYSSRKLKMKSNGHASGIHNWYVNFDKERTMEFDDILACSGEGIVITDLMGQGIDIASGNYSRGAEGYYYKDGKFVHSVDGITIAGNLKDMFMNIEFIGKDIDLRQKIKTGSILIKNMTVSGI